MRQMAIGGLLALPGLVGFILASVSDAPMALGAVYLLAAAGAIVFALGAVRAAFSSDAPAPPVQPTSEQKRDRAIVRSLLAVAAADGELKDSELNVIENYASKLADITLGDDLVRELFQEMTAQPVSIRDELTPIAPTLSEDERVTVYQGAALVGFSVPPLGPKERAALDQIAAALSLPPEATKQIEQRAEDAFADSDIAATVKYWLGLR